MVVAAKNIWKNFGDLNVLKDFTIEFTSRGINCIFGPSGCGKTTLINILSGLMVPDGGQIIFPDNKTVSFVFQEHRLIPWIDVEKNIRFILPKNLDRDGGNSIVEKVLDLVELSEFRTLLPHELSGGMKQRASIGRALARESDVLVLDEPFKGLNYELKKKLMDYVIDLKQRTGCMVFMITHDIDEVIYMGNYVYVFKGLPLELKEILEIGIPFSQRQENEDGTNHIKSALKGF